MRKYTNFSSLIDGRAAIVNLHLNNIKELDQEMLAITLMFCLFRNLEERGVNSLDHVIWKDFTLRNSIFCAYGMKLQSVSVSEGHLCKKDFNSLFSVIALFKT